VSLRQHTYLYSASPSLPAAAPLALISPLLFPISRDVGACPSLSCTAAALPPIPPFHHHPQPRPLPAPQPCQLPLQPVLIPRPASVPYGITPAPSRCTSSLCSTSRADTQSLKSALGIFFRKDSLGQDYKFLFRSYEIGTEKRDLDLGDETRLSTCLGREPALTSAADLHPGFDDVTTCQPPTTGARKIAARFSSCPDIFYLQAAAMSPHSEVMLNSSDAAEIALNGNGVVLASNGGNRVEDPPALVEAASHSNGVGSNGHASSTNGHSSPRQGFSSKAESSPYLQPAPLDDDFDLVCVGFGPASLAVAVAIHDALAAGQKLLPDGRNPRVLFVEKQARFAWHAGMLLPGAKMQISFIKDLATLRDPRSEFTFLNYLHRQDRLVDFTNLSTFLPARVEYEDYLRWCASHFERLVQFGQEVVSVAPDAKAEHGVRSFTVQSRDVASEQTHTYRARNVLVAMGGQPSLPKNFPLRHPRVIHSSQYAHRIREILPKANGAYRVAVVGAGQSAAEIFNNVQHLYPNSKTWLVMRPEFLRPSDDSPL